MGLSWMAWTWPTAAFFIVVVCCLITLTVWEIKRPGGDPRRGIFLIDTTRGDRLFITLLGSAFIALGWLYFFSTPLWGALVLSLIWGFVVFKWA